MFKNYFRTAWRYIERNKIFSLLNIVGLALGLACSLLIFLWVQDERNTDHFNTDKNIYDVYERVFAERTVEAGPWTPGLLARELKRNVPEIEYASGFENPDVETLFSVGNKNISLKGCHADSDFFKIFSYPLLEGTAAQALATPDAIAVSKTMAIDFFGSPAAAIGKTIRCNTTEEFKINAVFDLPANASQKFDFALNWYHKLRTTTWFNQWIYRTPYTYIRLRPGTNPERVAAKIKDFVTPYLSTGNKEGAGFRIELGLQRFDEMYLNANFKNGVPDGGRIEYLRLFSIIAIFILLIACINFMNLATARSVKRAKEVGIRKAVGALRARLIGQFIGEALLLTAFAVVLALGIVIITLPYFNQLISKQIILPVASFSFWLCIVSLLFLTGFVAGSYPALFLSSLNPVKVLKGSLKFGPGAILFRKGLVVFQFALSIIMITGTIIVSQQIRFVQNANLGYDKQNLVYIPFQGDLSGKFELFRQQLLNEPGIKGVTTSTQAPSHIDRQVYDIDWEGKDPNSRVIAIHDAIGYDFLTMLQIPLIQGRGFSRDFPADTSHSHPHFLINETLLKMTGYIEPVGKKIRFFGTWGTIIGVVKDFHLTSLRAPIEPLLFYWGEDAGWGGMLVKTQPGKTHQALAGMEKLFKQLEPRFPFRYSFTDEEYQKLYTSELTVSKLSDGFSFLAIFICCLGLLGLTMFTAEQRRKEIGVRKVIGASVGDIVGMLSKDVVKLILLSALIASPLAWLAMHSWLQNFAYRIAIGWWIFVIAGLIALCIALLTISYQAIKAALANPINSLRTE